MNIYMTDLLARLEKRQENMSPYRLAEQMIAMGLIDHTLCKVLAVRMEVESLMAEGEKKIDAMWKATEKFCCSYEYVRKCMYYYTDINIPATLFETVENVQCGTQVISQQKQA